MWYWKPEQPPPTTATRSAVGTGLCMLMISLTLVLATGVKLIINPLGLRSQAHPRSYQLLHYTRTLIRICNPVCLALKRFLSPHFRQASELHTIRCNDQTQSYSNP